MIDLTLLHHALAIDEAGSFAGAAKSLGLSQPTLSRQIGSLELTLGFRLFDRGRYGAVPTPLGREVLARATGLVQSATLLRDEINLLRGVEVGELKVGAGVYPAFISMGTALGRLAASHPKLRISVAVTDWRTLANEVLEARLDLAVVELSEHADNPSLHLEPLPAHPAVFVCRQGHPLLDIPKPTLADIFSYPYAGTRLAPRATSFLKGKPTAGHVDQATGEFVPAVEVNTLTMAMEVVSLSKAFGIIPASALGHWSARGQLKALPLRPAWLQTNYGFVTLRDRALSPAATAFMDEFRTVEHAAAAEQERGSSIAATPRKRGSTS